MKVLITGANGQLAMEFQDELKHHAYEVSALDRAALDITDPNRVGEVVSQYNPKIIFNCAAYNLVDKAEEDFDTAFKINALGVKNLASVCKEKGILLVHYSSDYVFYGDKEDFYSEEDETKPINKYGKSKLSGEEFLKQETDNFLLFRVSWVFGEGRQNFLYKLLEWAKKNNTLKIVYDQISIPTYTRDIVTLTLLAISKGLRGIYHLTNSGYASRYEVAKFFLERFGMNCLVLPVSSDYFPSPAKRPFFSAMSNRKLSEALNVDIPDWKIGIERYIQTVFEKEEI